MKFYKANIAKMLFRLIWVTLFAISCVVADANRRGALALEEPTNRVYVTEGGVLSQSNTYYILDNDLTSDDTCLAISATNVILDLNGHTLTFDDFPVGIENFSFEDGEGEIPFGWDLSNAPSAKRISNAARPMVGKWHLEFQNPTDTEEIVSTWTELPPDQWGVVYFKRGLKIYEHPDLKYSFYVEYEDGSIIACRENTTLEQGFFEFKIPADKQGSYRLRFKVVDPQLDGSPVIPIDLLDLRAAHNFGIYLGYGLDGGPGRKPDWDIPTTASNVVIKNGKIVQGRAGSFRGAGIFAYPCGNLTVQNVEFYAWGLETDAITICYSKNGVFENNTIVSDCPYKLNRHQLSSPINIFGGSGFHISGNQVTSLTGWGCITLCDVTQTEVCNNILKTKSTVVNHHAINCYNVKSSRIYGNLIEADPGQGILLSSNSQNNSITDNAIHLKSQAPSPDIGRHSLDGIRLNDYDGKSVSGNRISDNRIYITGYNDPFYGQGSQVVNGIANRGTGPNNVFENNYIYVNVIDDNVTGSGMEPGSLEDNEVVYRNNIIESNNVNIMFGGYVRHNHFSTFISNTFIKSVEPPMGYATPPEGGGSGLKGYSTLSSRAGASSMKNTHFIDTTLVNGASLDNLVFGHAFGDYSYFVDWYLNIVVKDNSGNPIADAAVDIESKTGEVVFSGTTDVEGKIEKIVLNQYEHYGFGMAKISYFSFSTPHIITVAADGLASQTKEIVMDSSKTVNFFSSEVGSGSLKGDLDGDGDIDENDYQAFRATLGKCYDQQGYNSYADYDEDGCVSYADYRIWYGYYKAQQM